LLQRVSAAGSADDVLLASAATGGGARGGERERERGGGGGGGDDGGMMHMNDMPSSLNALVDTHDWGAVLGELLLMDDDDIGHRRYAPTPLLPLHHALTERCPLEVVQAMLEKLPAEAAAKARDPVTGNSPLHIAARRGAPPDIIHALVAADPTAPACANANGALPLHAAAGSEAPSAATVRAILRAHPNAAAAENHGGDLPLHYACRRELPASVVHEMIAAHPAGAKHVNRAGGVPLHYAAQYRAPIDAVEALIEANPDAPGTSDSEGFTPLHLAQGAGDDVRVVEALLRAGAGVGNEADEGEVWVGGAVGSRGGGGGGGGGSTSISERADSRGCLPLHLAVGNGGSPAVVAALLRAGNGGAAARCGCTSRIQSTHSLKAHGFNPCAY
jgi:ankyrin repeat protein